MRLKIFLAMFHVAKLTLTLNDPHDMRKCYSISRSSISENKDSVKSTWIVFRNRSGVKVTYALEFFLHNI